MKDYLFLHISSAFGKATTLTGRTQIWDSSFNLILKKPILGYGLDTTVLLDKGILENDPHNGILYIILTQGFIGFIFTVYLFIKTLGTINQVMKNIPQIYPMVAFIFCWFCRGLVESSLSYTHFGFWILLVVIRELYLETKMGDIK